MVGAFLNLFPFYFLTHCTYSSLIQLTWLAILHLDSSYLCSHYLCEPLFLAFTWELAISIQVFMSAQQTF